MYRLMLVDDEPLILEGISRMTDWEASGFQIVAKVRSGSQAMEMLETVKPDVVLTDIRMPVMDGIHLTKSMLEVNPDLTVVVLSGYNDYENVREAFKAGAKDYVYKAQLSAEDLLSALNGALSGKKPQTVAAEDGMKPRLQGIVKDIVAYIDEHYASQLTLDGLSGHFHLNKSYFCQLFKSKTGMSFTEYLSDVRLTKARLLLRQGEMTVSQVCEAVGFQNFSYFCKCFKANTGMTPTAYSRMFLNASAPDHSPDG